MRELSERGLALGDETLAPVLDAPETLGLARVALAAGGERSTDRFRVHLTHELADVLALAGECGAAHLPGMTAAKTTLPVLGVPVQSKSLGGLDSLLSIVQMPAGVPVATFSIGTAGAGNAALCAAAILANKHPAIATALESFRDRQTAGVLGSPDPRKPAAT